MLKKSLNSVKVLSLNKSKVIKQLKKIAYEYSKKKIEIRKIILFGSLVSDDFTPYSDADLLLILDDRAEVPKRIRDRIPFYLPDKSPVPLDIFPLKQGELNMKLSCCDFFYEKIMENGIILFSR